jgi:hypothetical protein
MVYAQAVAKILFLCLGIWAERWNSSSNANEGGNLHRESDLGHKNDKARYGDEQAFAVTFT